MTKALLIFASAVVAALALAVPPPSDAQDDRPKPCSSPEARQLDFWIGEWTLTSRARIGPGEDDFASGAASNNIRAVLDGCVILENFDGMTAAEGFRGMSVSSWNPALGKWQQTWVDNAGGYLDFVGGMEGDKMILSREAEREGVKFLQRMVFENITADSLDWLWERSDDQGETWTLLWHLHYERK